MNGVKKINSVHSHRKKEEQICLLRNIIDQFQALIPVKFALGDNEEKDYAENRIFPVRPFGTHGEKLALFRR